MTDWYPKYFRVHTGALCRILPIAVLFAIGFSGPVWAENPSGKVVFAFLKKVEFLGDETL